jgi:flagellar biosynthetic protein FlhB
VPTVARAPALSTDGALPTKRKLASARRAGRVARSPELVAAGSALLAMVVLYYSSSKIVLATANLLKTSLTDVSAGPLTIDAAAGDVTHLSVLTAAAVIPALMLIACAPILMHWLQFGFLFVPNLIWPQLERIGGRRSNSLSIIQTWARGGLNLIKLTLVTGMIGFYIFRELPGLLRLMTLPIPTLAVEFGRTIVRFGVALAFVLLLPGILDYLVARWQFADELRMTQDEVREEQRASGRS